MTKDTLRVLFLSLFAIFAFFPTFSADFSSPNADGVEIYYNITSDNTVEVTSNDSKYSGDITIPSTVTYNNTTYNVTAIGNDAFYICSSLSSVDIPNSVTSIGEAAFLDCYNLKSIAIPNSVTSIGDHAFCGCSGLTSITIPNSVTSIGEAAFLECYNLKSIAIPNSVTSIGDGAFYSCTSLTSVTIPNSVTSIGGYAFYSCSSLTSATIPNSVTSIGLSAFEGCSSLTSITIPNSVTSIGEAAFGVCTSLTSITIPNSVTSIGHAAFGDCTNLTSIYAANPDPKNIELEASVFLSVDKSLCSLYVRPESIDLYKSASQWSDFKNIIAAEVCAKPVITVDNDQCVITCTTADATIYYTLDGTEPDTNSTVYTDPIALTHNCTIKAIAVKENLLDSDIAQLEVMSFMCSLPSISYDGQKVTITAMEGEVAAYAYSSEAEGDNFSEYKIYNGPFDAAGIRRVKAIAYKDDFLDSEEAVYDINAYYDAANNTVTVYQPGQMAQAFAWCTDDEEKRGEVRTLLVEGEIDNDDFATLRSLPQIQHLTISSAPQIPDCAFAGMDRLVSVTLPRALSDVGKDLFDGCNALCAIDWPSTKTIPENSIHNLANPNALLFVSGMVIAKYVKDVNIISNGEINKLILSDGEYAAFYTPCDFKANYAEYDHKYSMTTGIYECAGWETIALPFDVQTFTHTSDDVIGEDSQYQQISPFKTSDSNKHFWLDSLNSNGAFVPAETIKAYIPYAISLPNNKAYGEQFILKGWVKFSANSVTIRRGECQSMDFGSIYQLTSNMHPIEASETVIGINLEQFGNHAPGSAFISDRPIRAFEAYVSNKDGSMVNAPIPLRELFDQPEALGTVALDAGYDVRSHGGVLYITASRNADIALYTASGICVRTLHLLPGLNSVTGLPTGIYILNGQKICIR